MVGQKFGSVIAAALLVTGCASDLAVTKVGTGGSTPAGYPYRLKMTEFSVPITWRVTSCDPTKPDGLNIKVSADITSTTINDPDHFYVVDPRSLGGPFRNTEFSMEWYDHRGLKAITSSVDDQSGTVLVNVATGVAKLASVGIGLPAGPGGTTCDMAVLTALAAIGDETRPGLAAQVEATERTLAQKTLALATLTARAASMGEAVDDRTRAELGNATRELDALTNQLKLEKLALDEEIEVVTAKHTVTFPSAGLTTAAGPIQLPPKAQKDWNVNPSTLHNTDVYLRLRPLEVLTNESETKPPTSKPQQGLPYREPVLTRIEACSPLACDQADTKVVKKLDGPVLQTGRLFYLPFEARTFASVKNGATFSTSGVLMTATYSQPRGAGAGASEAFKSVSEQAAALVTAQRGAETARINAKAAQAKAQRELNDAVAALAPAAPEAEPTPEQLAIAAFASDVAVAKAETAAIEAVIARDAARALLSK